MRSSRGWRFRPLGQIAALALALGSLACASGSGPDTKDFRWRKARVHYDIGIDYMTHGRFALAIRELHRAEEIDPKDRWIPLALAEAYRRKGRVDEAEQYLQRALEIDPDFQTAQLNLGALYIQAERYEDAIPILHRLADEPTFPDPWRALTNLGWAEYKLGRFAEARLHLDQALDYNPGYWPARLDLGILQAHEGHPLQALETFGQVLEREPGRYAEAEVHYRMAEIYISLGRRDRAIEHLTAARERHPRGLWGKRSAEYLKILR